MNNHKAYLDRLFILRHPFYNILCLPINSIKNMGQVAMGCSGWNYYLKPAEKGGDGLMNVLQLKEMIVKNYRKSKKDQGS